MPTKEYLKRKQAYVVDYQRKHYTNVSFKLRTIEDKDVLDILASVPNKSAYIISLVRTDAGKSGR